MLIPRLSFDYQFQLLSACWHRSRKLPARLALSKFTVTLVAFAFALAMTGCGGGGGGSASVSEDEVTRQIASFIPDIQRLARRSDVATPQFGSVTQSVRSSTPSVAANASTDLRSADRLIFRVMRSDGTSFELDSADSNTVYVTEPLPSSLTRSAGRKTAAGGAVGVITGTESVAAVSGIVDWNSADPTDYFAGGYWIHIDADSSTQTITDLELGAFADGPEFRASPSLPTAGTAQFNGLAGGVYVSKYGTDLGLPAGSTEMGVYRGNVTLNANFVNSQISGLIDSIQLSGINRVVDGTVQASPVAQRTEYQVHLDAIDIEQDGTFSGDGVRITNPSLDIVRSQGKWGGRFSDRNDSAGNPRAVAGTHAGTARTAGGSEGTFLGAFLATTEDFE